jgi:hypothetical protein
VVAVVAGAPELVLEVVQALEPALQVFAKPAGSRAGRGFARRVEHASGGSVRKSSVGSGVRADVLRVASTCGECQSIASQDSQDSGVGTTARCDDGAHPMRRVEDITLLDGMPPFPRVAP